jgi:hypothetical protein
MSWKRPLKGKLYIEGKRDGTKRYYIDTGFDKYFLGGFIEEISSLEINSWLGKEVEYILIYDDKEITLKLQLKE